MEGDSLAAMGGARGLYWWLVAAVKVAEMVLCVAAVHGKGEGEERVRKSVRLRGRVN